MDMEFSHITSKHGMECPGYCGNLWYLDPVGETTAQNAIMKVYLLNIRKLFVSVPVEMSNNCQITLHASRLFFFKFFRLIGQRPVFLLFNVPGKS